MKIILIILCYFRKYEEIYPPDISEFVYITDDTYSKRQVIRMEHLILKVLGFDLSIPTPLTFITAMCVMNNLNQKTTYLAMVSYMSISSACHLKDISRFLKIHIISLNFLNRILYKRYISVTSIRPYCIAHNPTYFKSNILAFVRHSGMC